MLDLEPDDEEVELELDDGDELLSAALTAIISANTAARLSNVTNFRLSILAPLLLRLFLFFFFSSCSLVYLVCLAVCRDFEAVFFVYF